MIDNVIDDGVSELNYRVDQCTNSYEISKIIRALEIRFEDLEKQRDDQIDSAFEQYTQYESKYGEDDEDKQSLRTILTLDEAQLKKELTYYKIYVTIYEACLLTKGEVYDKLLLFKSKLVKKQIKILTKK